VTLGGSHTKYIRRLYFLEEFRKTIPADDFDVPPADGQDVEVPFNFRQFFPSKRGHVFGLIGGIGLDMQITSYVSLNLAADYFWFQDDDTKVKIATEETYSDFPDYEVDHTIRKFVIDDSFSIRAGFTFTY
jgi:hypothetical protein